MAKNLKPTDALEARRAEVTKKYEEELAGIERVERAYAAAKPILSDWIAGAEGRDGRIYVGVGSIHLTFSLGVGDIFASAEEHFCRAQEELRATFPAEWDGEWSEVRDDSNAHEARRVSSITLMPEKDRWSQYAMLFLNVVAWVREGSACQVRAIGTREVTQSVQTKTTVPVYVAICPGDPVEVAA